MAFLTKISAISASIITGLSLFSPFPASQVEMKLSLLSPTQENEKYLTNYFSLNNQIFSISPASAQEIIAQRSTITETEIEQIIAQLNQAANNQNVEGISKYLSPEAIIEMSLQSTVGSQNFTFNRDEYLFYLGESFQTTQNYQQSYNNLKVQISPDGKTALATLDVTESGNVNELSFFGTSAETIVFEVINDRIFITSVTANSNLELK